ncbi:MULTISPECIES: PspC domain-containing protein [Flavobacterium]|uniref:PspC domain-containing protein n=1 Tax=Flavobacterium sedimenticola TaxID=3043286 RepID=A0ABT6XQ02_9FLAO|nr:PspC domain-containing protein [Flavobacterium sedimenticola]MDI9257171.1 PspC domain-containing protein [Flavobacterium sedimenticola]
MNKTVNINIGGLFFHIDEDAFQKLSRYFDAIKRSLSNSSGKEEIMKDIEMRVAELLTEKQKSDKHVINLKDVDEVIVVMGQPEDYRIDDDATEAKTDFNYTNRRKKLYRDKDNGLIGGVCTGLGHYFGIDAVWIKILFLILAFTSFGLLAYIILWIATPKAVTTSEKLEMTGEPVTISNIEKKVREEFDSVSNKIKNANYDEMGNQVKYGAERAANGLGDVIMRVFGAFAKVLGVFVLLFSSFALLGVLIASVILIFSSTLPANTILNNITTPIGLETPLWIQGVLFLIALGIPLFFLIILGLKILVTNLKSIGNIAKYSLLAIWIIAVGVLVSLGINEATQRAFEGKSVKKEVLNLLPNDTLHIKFVSNDFFSKNVSEYREFMFTQDSTKKEVIYSNQISFEIKSTDKPQAYLQIEKLADGKSFSEANQRAEKINYGFKMVGNQLILDNYLLTNIENKYRDQKVELYLYLPKGTLFVADETVQNYDESDNEFFNLHYSSDKYTYRVEETQVKCLDCPKDENEYNDVPNGIQTEDINVTEENDSVKTVSVKINGKEVINTKSGKKSKLTISPDGVVIKSE